MKTDEVLTLYQSFTWYKRLLKILRKFLQEFYTPFQSERSEMSWQLSLLALSFPFFCLLDKNWEQLWNHFQSAVDWEEPFIYNQSSPFPFLYNHFRYTCLKLLSKSKVHEICNRPAHYNILLVFTCFKGCRMTQMNEISVVYSLPCINADWPSTTISVHS